MARPRPPTEAAVAEYMRYRRRTFFFGDEGPALPRGVAARWRIALDAPHEWHGNMLGAIEGPPDLVADAIDTAVAWFGRNGADTWIDADEWSVVFRNPALVESRGFVLNDDWNVLGCWNDVPAPANPAITLQNASTRDDFEIVARIAEQAEAAEGASHREVERRMERYWNEYTDWNSRFMIAWLDGEPVGTARLTDEDVPVVVGVATLPQARGHGVATTITASLTAQGLQMRGVCALYVDRGSQAERIYRRIGYIPLFRSRAWLRRWNDG
jgi:GNAT superfamily N-acetyltransferase